VVGVEERREDARRVKAWAAVPVEGAVGDARDADLAEHRGQAAGVTALGVGVLDSGCVGYVDQPLFSLGTHVQVVLQELPQQLPPVDLELLLPVPRATVAPIPRRPARPPPPRTVPVRRRTPHPWAGLRMLAPSFPSRALSWRRPGALPEGSQSHQPATSNAGMSSAFGPLQKSCTQINTIRQAVYELAQRIGDSRPEFRTFAIPTLPTRPRLCGPSLLRTW
jgi:hypothetical protein